MVSPKPHELQHESSGKDDDHSHVTHLDPVIDHGLGHARLQRPVRWLQPPARKRSWCRSQAAIATPSFKLERVITDTLISSCGAQ